MPKFEAELDIDPEEYVDRCSDKEKRELAALLLQQGYELTKESHKGNSISEQEFEEHLYALKGKWNLLTSEEEQTIKNVAKRFFP